MSRPMADELPPHFSRLVPTYESEPLVPTVYLMREPLPLVRGHVIVAYGPGGIGKGMVAMSLAALNSLGVTASGRPGTTIMITPEDDINETVAWRVRASGADPRRIVNLTTYDDGERFRLGVAGRTAAQRREAELASLMSMQKLEETITDLQAHDEELERAGITDPALYANPVLVVIEPLLACVSGNLLATDDGARSVIEPLQKLAARTGVCVLITHHSTKGNADIAGSRAMLNAPRYVYEFAPPKPGTRACTVSLRKGNKLPPFTAAYAIVGEPPHGRVVWGTPGGVLGAPEQVAGWRARALAGPLAAIEGAHPDPVTALADMDDAGKLAHLAAMHGGPPALAQAPAGKLAPHLRQMLADMHAGDQLPVVPHRHLAAEAAPVRALGWRKRG